MTATTHCTVCGAEIGLGVESYSSGTREATYTRERTKLWHFLAKTDQYYYYDYLQIIGPKLPVTTYSIEDGNGNILEYYEDESTGEYFIDPTEDTSSSKTASMLNSRETPGCHT